MVVAVAKVVGDHGIHVEVVGFGGARTVFGEIEARERVNVCVHQNRRLPFLMFLARQAPIGSRPTLHSVRVS